MFNVFNKNKSEINESLLKLESKESKSFINKIKPKFFKFGSKVIEQESLSQLNIKELVKKGTNYLSESINITSNNSVSDLELEEDLEINDYLMSSLLDLGTQKKLGEKFNEIELKKIKSKWKSFLILSESSISSKLAKEWIAIESMIPKCPDYMSITELDLLINDMRSKPILMPDGKFKFIKKEEELLLNSLKIELFDLAEKYPMGMKEVIKNSNTELPSILLIEPSYMNKVLPYLHKNPLSWSFKEGSPVFYKNESKYMLKLKNGLSQMLYGQIIKDGNIERNGWKKEFELLHKLLDTHIQLKEPWSDVFVKEKLYKEEKDIISGSTNTGRYLLNNSIDRTLPYFKRLIPVNSQEYLKICNEMNDYSSKAEQIIKWNEWAIYQILETYKYDKSLVKRDFVWYNKNYLPFYGPLPNNIDWANVLKSEFDSLKEVQSAQEIYLKRKLPLPWEVIQDNNEFWDKDYKLFQREQRIKMQKTQNELYSYLNNLYNNEKKEWLRVYDLARRIKNDTYNYEWADKYNEIEDFFFKENGYSYREKMWKYDRYMALLDQGWIRFEKGKSSEYKKRIAELELKWKKSADRLDKLKQNERLIESNKIKDLKKGINVEKKI